MNDRPIQYIPTNLPDKIGFETVREALGRYLFTPNGRRQQQTLQPAADREQVRRINTDVSELILLIGENESVPLSNLEEIGPWLEKARAEGAILPPEALLDIREHALTARRLREFFSNRSDDLPGLWKSAGEIQSLPRLEEQIESVLTDQGEVKESASNKLKSVRRQLNSRRQKLRTTIENVFRGLQKKGMASDEGPTLRGGRMVLPVQAEYKRKVDGFVHDVSASGQTIYLEPVEALQINNDIRELEAEERREVERILRELTQAVRENRRELSSNAEWIGTIDLLHARAKLGHFWQGESPRFSDKGEWMLTGARNPLLILKNSRLKPDEKEEVVPLDLKIEPGMQGIVISGPNAGGKSVALKTVGLMSMLFQCGIPLPADPGSRLPVISGIFLDMGDEQSIETDLSTFSSRLQWMRNTLDAIGEKSLVLIDEAGTGTDPEEGGALFQAFIEAVLAKKSTLLVTTHHGALKTFAHEHPELENAAMEFDQATLSPTYRFHKGVPGSSYAFEIAGRMKLPVNLLERSRELLGSHRDKMGEMLLDLEKQLQEARNARKQYEKLRIEAEKEAESYRSKSDELEKNRNARLEQAYRQAEQIVSEANRKIERAVERIVSAGRKDKKEIRKARKEIEGHKKKIRKELEEVETGKENADVQPPSSRPEIGDRVLVSGGDTEGELIEVNDGEAVVQAGGLRLKTKYDKLVKSEKKKSRSGDRARRWQAESRQKYQPGQVGTSIDLRGQRGDEAVRNLMHYLDNAVAAGLREVEVIHGKGEGILKKLASEYLEQRKEVKSFEEAPIERGGAGCTIVYL